MTATARPRSFGGILRDHLDAEIAAHRALLAAAEAFGAAVVANDRARLPAALARQDESAVAAARLRHARERIIHGTAEHLGLRTPHRLPAIVAALGADAEGVEERRAELVAIAAAVQRCNERNQALLRAAHDLVAGVLHLVAGEQLQPGGYGPRGRQPMAVGGGLVDLKG